MELATPIATPTSGNGLTHVDEKMSNEPTIATQSAEEVESPTSELGTVSSDAVSVGSVSPGGILTSSDASKAPTKGILNNPEEAPRKASRSSSTSRGGGFKAALKASFKPPPTPGKQMKLADGQKLGKTFKREDPLPDGGKNFEGGEVLEYDPRGPNAGAGDGLVPPEALRVPPRPDMQRRESGAASESGYASDWGSSVGSEAFDEASEYSVDSSPSREFMPGSGGPGILDSVTRNGRHRQASTASTTSNSSKGAAIRFCPLPTTGRLKRANSITIGVAARAHLLQSQGTAAPQRQGGYMPPQRVHSSQAWYNDPHHPDVIDVGEEIRKGALKAWKKIRGSGSESEGKSGSGSRGGAAALPTTAASNQAPKKHYPKEGAPVADPATGHLKVAGGPGIDRPGPERLASLKEDVEHGKGDATPKRGSSLDLPVEELSIQDKSQIDGDEAAAAQLAAATEHNSKTLSNGHAHHPHELEDGPQHDSFHLADRHDAMAEDGMATPRSNMQRRSSTGAYLHGLSIKGIQEARRRQFLGLDDEDADDAEAHDGKAVGSGYEVRGPSGKLERVGLAGYGH